MKRAGVVDMAHWQGDGVHDRVAQTDEAALHACNTPACFAGWVAVSPEFQADGGTVRPSGAPSIADRRGDSAIAVWLCIPAKAARDLCGAGVYVAECFYGRPAREVTAEHVIEKLEELLCE